MQACHTYTQTHLYCHHLSIIGVYHHLISQNDVILCARDVLKLQTTSRDSVSVRVCVCVSFCIRRLKSRQQQQQQQKQAGVNEFEKEKLKKIIIKHHRVYNQPH